MKCGGCGRFRKDDLYTTDQCRYCWLGHHHAAYRAYYAGELPPAAVEPAGPVVTPDAREALRRFPIAVRKETPCRHLGGPTGRALLCSTCGGEKTTPEHGCVRFGTCTPGRMAYGDVRAGEPAQFPWCLTCVAYEPPPPP